MTRRNAGIVLCLLLLDVPATIMLFLPFALSTSPYEAMREWEPGLGALAAPFFLPIIFVFGRVLELFSRPPRLLIPILTWAAYGISAGMAGWLYVYLTWWVITDPPPSVRDLLPFLGHMVVVFMTIGMVRSLLVRGGRHRLVALVAARGVYLASIVLVLIVLYDDYEAGARLSIAVGAAYLGEILWRARQAWRYPMLPHGTTSLCAACGYDIRVQLSGGGGDRCPECGEHIPAASPGNGPGD